MNVWDDGVEITVWRSTGDSGIVPWERKLELLNGCDGGKCSLAPAEEVIVCDGIAEFVKECDGAAENEGSEDDNAADVEMSPRKVCETGTNHPSSSWLVA